MIPPPIRRRDVLRATGLAGLAGVGLTGCGSAFASGVAGTGTSRETLTYWTLLGGGDGGRMVTMEDAYQKAYPAVDLSAVTLAWGNPYYTKLTLATLGKHPPDVGIAHLTRATILAESGLLEPFDADGLAEFGMTPDRFTPAAWQKAHTNGKLYAIPLDTHPFVLYYNTDVCKKAGLLDADGRLRSLDGPSGLADALQAAKKVTGQYGGVMSINADPSTQWRLFSTLYWQLGGEVLADNGRRIVLDRAKAERVLSYIADLTVTRKVMPSNIDYGGATTLFASGKAGFYFQGDWEITTFQTSKTPFSMTRIPNVFGGRYTCQADSHSFVLPRDAGRDPDRRRRTLRFIRTLLDHSDTWAQGGHIPAWLPYRHSAPFRTLQPQADYAGVANSVQYDPPAWYSGSGSDFENIMGFAVGAVAAGQLTPAVAVDQITTKLTKYAETPTPV
ncbi:MAG: extracellular solute-binding protein [Actinocatenispora sp.]